jgi:3-hydroxybutyryl-CoA dehydratase
LSGSRWGNRIGASSSGHRTTAVTRLLLALMCRARKRSRWRDRARGDVVTPRDLSLPPTIAVGDRFSTETTFTRRSIAEFAKACGDHNPVHTDDDAARSWGFAGVIASGPHTSALFGALLATHYGKFGPTLGLELSIRFQHAVIPDVPVRFAWEVVAIEYNEKLVGNIVSLQGSVEQSGRSVMSGRAKIVVRTATSLARVTARAQDSSRSGL